MFTLPSQSIEYVRVPVSATSNGSAVDPTADPVKLAFVAEGTIPSAPDFHTGSWETDATQTPTVYYARALVGTASNPGIGVLAVGIYDVWVQVSDSPEVPARRVGTIRVI